jgi:uncharacterized protein YjbI with pentapeptide repeats
MKKQIVLRWDTKKVLFECDVPDRVVSGLEMRHALEQATAAKTDLQGADLRGANLQGAYLRGSDLRGAYLQGAYLQDADLEGAYLQGADLQDANLQDADLEGAYLRGSDLQGAYLRGSDLRGADLRGANLQGADLQDADLQDADLEGVDGKQLPRATPEQAIDNLDKVRAIVLDNRSRLNMGNWHGSDGWKGRTCAEETLCGTTHCIAGWLQVCTTEPALKNIETQLAGTLAAPVAAKMFFKDDETAFKWLASRAYVAETEEAEKRRAERMVRKAQS